jgi:hypothetical protein
MQFRYTLRANALDNDFLEKIKTVFEGRQINITIEDTTNDQKDSQILLFDKMEDLRKKLKNLKVNPEIDLSALANEINL